MKKLFNFLILIQSILVFGQQPHSGGINTAQAFKVVANKPIDDRTVALDSVSLLSIPNKYEGLTTYSIADDALFVYDGAVWNRASPPANITLEQARQNGNAVEGDIRFNNWSGLVFENSQNPANTPYRLENEDGFFGLKSSTNTGDKLAITLDNGSNYIRIDNDGNSKGLTGTYEYDKQGDRKAFAQIADIEDAIDNIPSVSASISGIVNNTPLQELGGVDKLINGVRIGRGNNSLSYNYLFGDNSLNSITIGNGNVAVGGYSLTSQTIGSYNLGIGFSSLFYNDRGFNNVAIGAGALSGSSPNTYSRNIAIGTSAGNALTEGDDNILIGGDIDVGESAGLLSGNNNIIIGKLDNKIRTASNNNTIIGGFSEVSDTSMSDNIILSDGKGNIGFRKDDNGLTTSPTQTQLTFDSDLSGKAIVTKEILGNMILPADLQEVLDNGNTADGVGIILTDGSSLGQYYADAIGIQENVGGGNGITISPAEGGFLYAGDNGRVHLGDRDGVVGLNFETLTAKMNIIPPTSFVNATHTLQNKSGVLAHVEDLEDYILEPTTDGTSGQVLTTDGSGGRSWTTVSSGGAPFNPIAGTGISLSGTYPNITISNSMPNLLQSFESTLTIGNLVGGAAANAGFVMSSSNAGTGETYNTQVTKSIVSVSHKPDNVSPTTTLTMSGLTRGMRMQVGNNEVAQFGIFNDDLGVHFYDFFETESISITAPTKTDIRVQELQDKSGTIALLSDISESIEDSFSAIEVNGNLTLNDTHKNKQILITGNNRAVTIPNTLSNNFNVTLDFSGTGATIINNASATGDGDHTTSPYDIPQNGMIYIYKTESGTVRIKGDIL